MPEIALRQYESEIDHLIEEARYLEALAHARHILREYPRYIGAYYLLGKTMLEADQPELAVDMFQRALNADPEHLMARIGLMLAHQRLDNLDAAIWNLERAIELNPGDVDLVDELRQLCARRDGFEPERVPLNRAGLARLYMRGNRPGRAVEELRALLAESPQRLDLRLALAEAYWRDDQIVQAADTCQTLLDDARYCLKANLLLGALWIDSGQEEGQTYLDRAQEIDLENTLASEMFGTASPLKPREVSIEQLTYRPDALDVDQQAKWFRQLEAASVTVSLAAMQPEMTETEARLVDITAGLEAQIEIPDWLRELGDEEDGALSWMADISAEAEAAGAAEAAEPVVEAQMPDWLRGEEVEEITAEEELPDWLRAAEPEEAIAETGVEGLEFEEGIGVSEAAPGMGVPDWLSELEPAAQAEEGAPGASAPEADIPDWLQALQPAAPAATEEIPLPEAGAPGAGMPDWLSQLKRPGEAVEAIEGEPTPGVAPSEEVPDWLQSLQPAAAVEEETVEVEEELPEWMEGFAGIGETTEEAIATEEGALPDWLTGFQPEETAEEAPETGVPDWLSELESAAGLEAEAEAGAPGAGVPEEGMPEEGVPEEGIPDWLSELQPAGAQVEEVPVAEGIAPGSGAPETGIPDWLSELEPAAGLEAEAEAVEEDLLGWLGEIPAEEAAVTAEETLFVETLIEEILPEEPAFGKEVTPVIEETPVAEGFFGWEAFGEEITEIEATPPIEEEVSAPALVAEGKTLSGDDALAWLESLAAGKEDELRAQAEAETQVRVAEILGHKPAAKPEATVKEPAPVVEKAPAGEDTFELEAAGEEIEEGELDWENLAEQFEEAEGTISTVTPAAEGEDALAWLESLDAGEAEEFFTETEVEAAQEPLAEAPAESLEEAPGAESFFGWEAFGEEITEVAAPAAEGDLMSGDDALAWLESLTAGKEEELRAQAEAEAQVRVAEILGHRPESKPAEPEPVVEEPPLAAEEIPATEGFFGWEAFGEEITEVETAAPAVEEAVFSEVESITEGDAKGVAEEAEIAAGNGLLSGDDALAWLSSLAAGKEEELRAQAEAETQARVAEILGRRPETRAEEPTVKEPVVEVPIEPEVAAAEVTESAAAEIPVAEGDVMSGDDALAWLSSLAAGKEEELRAQAEAETQARVAEILGRRPEARAEEPTVEEPIVEEPVVETPIEPEVAAAEVAESIAAEIPVPEGDVMSGDDALAWLSSLAAGKEEELRAQAEAEAQARVAEILGRKPESKVAAPEETGEPEEPAVPEVVAPAIAEVPAPKPVIEEVPTEIAEEIVAEEIVAEAPKAEPEAVPEEALPAGGIARMEPGEDAEYAGLLAQARAAWKAGDTDTALLQYSKLIQAEAGLDDIIADLKEAIAEQPNNAALYQVLGDAYMANGMIDQAIEIFNQAMGLI